MTIDLDRLLRARDGDRGCDVSMDTLAAYVELELEGEARTRPYPLTAIHLECCPGCRADHDGLLEAARRFGHTTPE
jgi:predicted anti-sigma-YlaC factor YlaD